MINHQQFEWAMARLAQMQGTSLDVLSLRASLTGLGKASAPLLQLKKIAAQMGLDEPGLLDGPDRAYLPLLCHADDLGWAVVIDCDPSDQWVLVNADGQHTVGPDALQGKVALVKFNPQEDANKLSQAMGEKPR